MPRQNYHVTLKFLGEVEQGVLRRAVDAVDALDGRAVSTMVTGLAGLPRSARARLAAAVLEREPHLERWRTELQDRLGAEERGFRPHVTVVRFRSPRAFRPIPLPEPFELALEPPRLYRSDQTPEGVRYRPVAVDG